MSKCQDMAKYLNVEIWIQVQVLRYGYVSKFQDLAKCLNV